MELIRYYVGAPIFVTSGLRPGKYNEYIGGAKRSQHTMGKACDFWVVGYEGKDGSDAVRELLKPKLEDFGIRMENLPGATWVHIDLRKPGKSGRYFKP